MIKYIHIGYPKNLSTTLQRDFFSKHPEILHLGVGVGSNIDYVDDDINVICEDYLQYCKEFKYEEKKKFALDTFDKWFDKAKGRVGCKVVGLSLELLSFSFTPDQIDTPIKAQRVFELFGKDTRIIMIIRNQKDLIKSMYRESVKLGYQETFTAFLKYLYLFQDRNFLYDFCYDKLYSLYARFFGKDNIIVIPVEDVRECTGSLKIKDGKINLIDKLCNSLDISYFDVDLGHFNAPIERRSIERNGQTKWEAHS